MRQTWSNVELAQLQRSLLRWFKKNARTLPWRRSRDPYAVWVSEIMLQQTTVAAVIPYFERFLADFPNVAGLAAATEQQVLRHWEGLGYYRRARQLHAAAQQIVATHGGEFPRTLDEVNSLPGIGPYTSGAILSIAFDARLPILEANTVRLLSRLAGYRHDPHSTAGRARLWQIAESLLPKRNCGAFNQALMEVGSLICTPRQPKCDDCPLRPHCRAFAAGLQDKIPLPKVKPVVEQVREAALVIRRSGRVLIWQWQPKERWAGLWDFPRFPLPEASQTDPRAALNGLLSQRTGVTVGPIERFATINHSVTRFRIALDCFRADCQGKLFPRRGDLRFVRPAELEHLPLSVTGRKISQMLLA